MIVTRKPEDDFGDATLGAWNKAGDDYHLLVDDKVIGGTYWCGAGYKNGQRWASWGPAGLSMGHRTREDAEAVQVKAYAVNPSEFDRINDDWARERTAELAASEQAAQACRDELNAARDAARRGTDEPGPTTFTVPAYHCQFAPDDEARAVLAWLEANDVQASGMHPIRVEQRDERAVIVYEQPTYGTATETRVVTLTVEPPTLTPVNRPEMVPLLTEHSEALFPLAHHRVPACAACTPAKSQLVSWPCDVVLAAVGTPVAVDSDAA